MNNINEIVSALDGKLTGVNSWICHCPVHQDKASSLSVSVVDDKILFHCHAGCSQESVLDELKRRNLWVEKSKITRKIVSTYDYTDKNNKLLYQVCRFEPKDFRQRRPDGNGGWIWNLKGVNRILYNLREVMGSDQVFICEGEKDVDALTALNLVSTTNAGGASKWLQEYSEYLNGKDCIILPDNDKPGREHAEKIAASLWGSARSVKIVELPGIPGKGDIYDWLNNGNTKDNLLGLVEITKEHELNIDQNLFSDTENHGDAGHTEKPSNNKGWEHKLLEGVDETGRKVAATKLAGLYLSKDYAACDTITLLNQWNERNHPPLEDGKIEKYVNSIYKLHQKEKDYGIAEAVEKITIYRYPDGTNKYKLCLSGNKYVLIRMGDLLSSMKTIERIADATRIVFNPPKQQRWFDLVRIWLKAADEKVVDVEESELGIIKEIISSWLIQWDKQKDSKHINLATMLNNNCVEEEGRVYFTLNHLEEALRFKNAKLTRTLLCEFLRRLGAKITEPRKRFDGARIRTWEIPDNSLE